MSALTLARHAAKMSEKSSIQKSSKYEGLCVVFVSTPLGQCGIHSAATQYKTCITSYMRGFE